MLRLREIQRKQAEAKAGTASSAPCSASPSPSLMGNSRVKAVSTPQPGPQGLTAQQPPTKSKSATVAEMRAQKDISEMDPCPGAVVSFPDPDNLMKCQVKVRPSEGYYAGGEFVFSMAIPPSYPYDPPRVHCETQVWHPNINIDGAVCLNILRADWMPVLNVGSVVFGLLSLFLEPNGDDPLNKEAAEMMRDRPQEFERTVRVTLRGGSFFGRRFARVI